MQWQSVRLWLVLWSLLTAAGTRSDLLAQAAPRISEIIDGVTCESVRPSETDVGITAFNDPHWIYIKRDIVLARDPLMPADRHELLLWLPGTRSRNAPKSGYMQLTRGVSHTFCLFAASLGYHVIALSYPNLVSTASCNNDPDPAAYATFRRSIVAGGSGPHIVVNPADSIQNRLIKALYNLTQRFPGEGWDCFLNADGSIPWEKIAVAGQSQGGGHAAFIGVRRHVSRVVCFGGPKDYSVALQAPAAWYAETSATPKDRFFTFNHQQDHQGCSPEHQMANLKALSLEELGAPVSVDDAAPPFHNSRILTTNYPGTAVSSETAHATMINPANRDRFLEVWRYMLTK